MKKIKLSTYALLLIVLLIWGTIGYKIYDYLRPNQEPEFILTNFAPESNLVSVLDTFVPQFEYDDPFVEKKTRIRKVAPNYKKVKQEFPKPALRYKAFWKVDRKVTVLIEMGGEDKILTPGEQLGDYRLIKATDQKIWIQKGKRRFSYSIIK